MTNIPAKIVQRRWELKRWAEYHREKIEDHRRSLVVVEAQLEQILFDTGAYVDCAGGRWADDAAEAPKLEAGAQGEGPRATSGAPEAESAPAGSGEGLASILTGIDRPTMEGRAVGAAADERLDSRTPALGNVSESPSTNPPPEGQGPVVSEDGITYGIGGLLAFLQAAPNSTMAEINAAGIPTAEVYRAERDGAVRLVQTTIGGLGLYALPLRPEAEAQQSEATE